MAVVSSGEIKLRGDVNLEINGNTTDANVSLATLSVGAGFAAPHGLTEFYGYTDAVAPSVSTSSAISITTSSMTIRGSVNSDGGGTITERGFYFGTNSSNATSNTKYTVSGTTGSFSRSMTGLSASSTYYWWAYATNSAGTTIASRVQATTSAPSILNVMTITSGSDLGSTKSESSSNGSNTQYMLYAQITNSSGGNVSVSQSFGGPYLNTASSTGRMITYYNPWPNYTTSFTGNVVAQTLPNGFNRTNVGISVRIEHYLPCCTAVTFTQYANHTFSKSGYVSHARRLMTVNHCCQF